MTTDPESLPKLSNIGLADAGMAIVAEVVSNPNAPGMGWVFRSLPTADVGIDGQIEVVVRDDDGNRRPNGHIISVQVKAGPSYFVADRGDFWLLAGSGEDAEPDEDELHDTYLAEHGTWDSEDEVYIDSRGEFSEYLEAAMDAWRNGFIGEEGHGEVSRYRVELKLTELGQAFLEVSNYLRSGPPPARSD